jgi:hypothetical protein
MRRVSIFALALAFCLLNQVALAAPQEETNSGHPAIVWVGTVATNLFYVPAKLAYAGIGAVTGAFG